MRLIIDENIVIFLDKIYLKKLNLTDQNLLEKKLIKLINKIQNKFTLDLNGYYNMYIYKDKNYGLIIDMQKEDIEYLDYFNNQIELNIEVIEESFLYKVEDVFNITKSILDKFIIYKNGDTIYLKAKEKINNIELGIILENGEIIYGKEANTIKKNSQIIKV